jgi:polysaccharide export outer membrane protein
MRTSTVRFVPLIVGLAVLVAAGCAPRVTRGRGTTAQSAATHAAAPTVAAPADSEASARNLERLAALHRERQGDAGDADYRVGPGDVLSVKAYELDELNQRVRVDGDGNIVLPLLNTVPVAGKSMAELERDLTARLGAYMYHPKVTVFVEEYRSQQVAVVGAVQRPGVIAQTNRNGTVLDAMTAAGGKTATASSRVYLIPAETRGAAGLPSSGEIAAASAPCGTDGADDCAPKLEGDPIVLDANETPQGAQATFLSLPVRGGDVIVVPGNGHFVVEGWVEKPGAFPLQSGLTLRGGIATAGGLSFPAEPTDVRIFRRAPNGTAETLRADLNAIADRRATDVFLHEGDVIQVVASPAKLASWSAYRLVTDVIKVGARIPMF